MLGKTIEARSPFSWAFWFFTLIGAGLLVWAGVTMNPHPLLGAVLPLLLAGALWISSPPHTVLLVENDGLRPIGAVEPIAFRDMSGITIGGALTSGEQVPVGTIEINHSRGMLTVPPVMNADFGEFCRFLVGRLPPKPTAEPHPQLAEYAAEQIKKFGADRISIINVRPTIRAYWQQKRKRWRTIALFATAIIWLVVGIAMGSSGKRHEEFFAWAGVSVFVFIAALIGLAVTTTGQDTNRLAKAARAGNACIVLGPAGIAMVQGDLRGAMRWDEVVKATSKFSQFFRSARLNGVQLAIRGGEIIIFDIYTHSPAEIEARINGYLRGPAG